jgi:carbon monoxide dehydrogenase subunit G
MEKIKVVKSLEINASPEKIFNFITDPSKIPSILPGLIENSNVPALPLTAGAEFNYKYQMYGVILEGKWTVDELNSPTLYKAHTNGGIDSWWTQEISGSGEKSIVTLTVEYEMPDGVLSKIKANALMSINDKEADHMLHNLKTILEMQ